MTDSTPRPDILFIVSDQHRGDCLSCEGHPAVLTPNLDTIGVRGVRFSRAYATCPSCIPARRALLTGQHPATNGLVGFQDGLPIASPTLPALLHDAGYDTRLVGRTTHQFPPNEPYGYEQIVSGSTYLKNDDYARDLENAFPNSGGIRGVGLSFNGWAARPWPFPEDLHPTTWVVQRSRELLDRPSTDRPLMLQVSTYAPHPPLMPPPFYMERYLRMEPPAPAVGEWAEASLQRDPGMGWGQDSNRVRLDGEALRSAQAGYFGLVNHLDDHLYWLIREFCARSERRRRPWLVVYTSDHGEMLGDHHYFRKCEPYEGSARIPLLIMGSQEFAFTGNRVHAGPVCLEDLLPTLLDLAGLEAIGHIDGRSLAPILHGSDRPVRDVLHGEHAPCYTPGQAHHYLTDGRFKYIWRPDDGSEQLFDLSHDPRELRDLAPSPKHAERLTTWRLRLVQRLARRPEGFTDGERLVSGKAYPAVLATSGSCNEHE